MHYVLGSGVFLRPGKERCPHTRVFVLISPGGIQAPQ